MKGLLSIVIVATTISVYAQSPSEPDRLVDEYALTETLVGELETQRLQLDQYLKKPLDLNRALAQELEELGLLSPLQIDAWIRFREQFGFADSWYVFQAVPGWDQSLVERLRPFCKLGGRKQTFHQFLNGRTDHFLLTRLNWRTQYERVNQAVGGNVHRLWRYKIQSEAGWSGGVLMENDAGERFGTRGPDFLSAFLQFKQDGGRLRVLLGDYSVQFGQGLICWQGMSFGMGTDLVGIKRQGLTVRP